MRPYLGPPWTNFHPIWAVDVYHHAPPMHGIQNTEIQKKFFVTSSLLYSIEAVSVTSEYSRDDGSVCCCYDNRVDARLQNCVMHCVLHVIGCVMSDACHGTRVWWLQLFQSCSRRYIRCIRDSPVDWLITSVQQNFCLPILRCHPSDHKQYVSWECKVLSFKLQVR